MIKPKLIIIEGPNGSGKTTLTNYLRDNISGSNLYRLSGQKDKTSIGKKYSTKMYKALIEYLKEMQHVPMDVIFDRTFFTEEVYGRLGYKEYEFTDVYNKLVTELVNLNYDIYYFSLYLKNTDLYKKRTDRGAHHKYHVISIESCIQQQQTYHDLCNELANKDIHLYEIPMDNIEKAYDKINNILDINKGEKL